MLVETRKRKRHRLSWQIGKSGTVYAQECFSELVETFSRLGTLNGRRVPSASGLANPKKMAFPGQHFSPIRCFEKAFLIRTTAVALTKVHEDPTRDSFSSLAVASDENENHFTYLESSKMKKGKHQLILFVEDLLLVVTCKKGSGKTPLHLSSLVPCQKE